VINYIAYRVRRQSIAVACFYFDFTTQEEQSPTNMLGARAGPNGLEKIPEEPFQAFQNQKKVIGIVESSFLIH
jgi:hypothetical protein